MTAEQFEPAGTPQDDDSAPEVVPATDEPNTDEDEPVRSEPDEGDEGEKGSDAE